jgi:phage terminase Nu1 subunit (DNA packaging protein)
MQKFVTKAIVASAFGVDLRTITCHQDQGVDPLPIAVKGRPGVPHKYDIEAVFGWGFRRKLDDLEIDKDGKAYVYETERARLTHEQADKVTLENSQLRGELIPRELVVST